MSSRQTADDLECARVRPLLSESVDGETIDLTAEDHIASCESCTAYAEQLSALRRHLRFSTVEHTPDIAGEVMATLTERPARFSRRRRLLTFAAAIVALGAAGLATSTPRPSPASDTASSISVAWSDGLLPGDATGRVQALEPVVGATKADLANGRLLSFTGTDGAPVNFPNSLLGVEILGYDPTTYPAFASPTSRSDLTQLGPAEAVVSSRTAERMAVGPGSTLTFENQVELVITAVVPDADIAAAEIAVTQSTARSLGEPTGEYLVVEHTGDIAAVAAEIGAEFDTDGVQYRAGSGAEYLRGGDDPTSQSDRKERFGEYTLIPIDDERLVPDPTWQANNIAESDVPLLGTMHCHRSTLEALAGAMRELQSSGQTTMLDPARTHRCWVPVVRRDASAIDVNRIWGIAVELNYDPVQATSTSSPALREIMRRWGFDFLGDDNAGVFVFRTDQPPASAVMSTNEPPKAKHENPPPTGE